MTRCSLAGGYQHFGETSCFHLQGTWRQHVHINSGNHQPTIWFHNPEGHIQSYFTLEDFSMLLLLTYTVFSNNAKYHEICLQP